MLSRPRAVLSKAFTVRLIGCEWGQFLRVDIGRYGYTALCPHAAHLWPTENLVKSSSPASLPSKAHFPTHISSDNPVKGS